MATPTTLTSDDGKMAVSVTVVPSSSGWGYTLLVNSVTSGFEFRVNVPIAGEVYSRSVWASTKLPQA